MRRILQVLCVTFVGLGAILPARAAVDEALDARAVAAYRAGDFDTARSEWLRLLDATDAPRGAERARILYDLGNVAFREGRALESVGWYSAALRLAPRDPDTWANLEIARGAAKLAPADRGDLMAAFARLVRGATRAESEWLALVGLAALAAALGYEALRGGRAARILALVAACSALVLATPWMGHLARDGVRQAIVIEADKALVRSEPRERAAVIAEVQSGSDVEVVDDLLDWTKVRLAGGLEGWVQKRALFPVDR